MDVPPMPPCDSCGRDVDEYVVVLKTLPNRDIKDVLACDDCEKHYEKLQYLRIRLDRFPYIVKEWPPFWLRDVSLYGLFDGKQAHLVGQLPLDDFPLIEDFEIILEAFVKRHLLAEKTLQYKVKFFSPSVGYLAHFSENDTAQNLCREDFTIPGGSFDTPFVDFEQVWRWSLLIAEDEKFVYVLTYREKSEYTVWHFPAFEDYEQNIWFKVEKNLYYSQWEKAIQLCQIWRRRFL